MKILAVETATEACSAALWLDGEILERYEIAPQAHNRRILPMLDSLLAEAGLSLGSLDGLAFGRGPGSFTGVRIATGVIQGLSLASGLPVAPISTLAALAQEALDETTEAHAYACIDARMSEVYWAVYERDGQGLAQLLGTEAVLAPEAVTAPHHGSAVAIGSGWASYGAILAERTHCPSQLTLLPDRFPRASPIARLGTAFLASSGGVDAAHALPVYLRDRVAKKPKERELRLTLDGNPARG
jgi:tRNA threonylcarbamoyladenosine biosynthesis protein TsaB